MKGIVKMFALGLTATLGAVSWGPSVARAAADPVAETARLQAEVARLQGEVARLQQDLREQRQLVMNLMQAEQQRYDVLLQLIRSQGGGAALPPMPALPPVGGSGGRAAPPIAGTSGEAAEAASGSLGTSGKIAGKAILPADAGEAYVYVEGLRGGPGARPHQVEIKQKDKQFSPQVVAIPVGSKLVFPNVDTVFHNVFSTTAGHAFDTGTVKGGESSRPVTLTKSGHVEIFCNIHRKMRADVLVVPNGYFARVAADGSFELAGIPAGTRRLVLWAPGIKPAVQQVEVPPKGVANVRFTAQAETPRPHLNKLGQVYGSYDD